MRIPLQALESTVAAVLFADHSCPIHGSILEACLQRSPGGSVRFARPRPYWLTYARRRRRSQLTWQEACQEDVVGNWRRIRTAERGAVSGALQSRRREFVSTSRGRARLTG